MDDRLSLWLKKPIAHRGLHDVRTGASENSMCAFERAIKGGYPIECDLRLSADGEVVIFHDQSTSRMCGDDFIVEATSLARLRRLKFKETTAGIPLLSELLELCRCEVPLLLELKVPKFSGELERKVLKAIKGLEESVAIQSFHHISLWWWKKNAPSYLRGMLAGDLRATHLGTLERLAVENLFLLPLVKPHFISYEGSKLHTQVLSLINHPIIAWTSRSQEEQDHFLTNLASNVIFEGYTPR